MNWVGGARSRVKIPNEKKVQRDYFQRKRLTTEINRANTRNHRVPISKDLLFLSKAASITAAGTPNRSPIPAPRRVNLDSAAKQHPRDIELPMSPIEKPSTLDLMEISTVSFGSSGSFHHSSLNSGKLPKVSTQKIPHGTMLNSFGARVVPGTSVKQQQGRGETAGRDMTAAMACMTESLFPTGNNKRESSSTTHGKTSRMELNTQPCKKYSIDDILNSSQFKESFIPQRATKSRTVTKLKSKHADALLWARPGRSTSRKRVNPFQDHDGLESVATRKMQKTERRYQFEEWNILQDKPKISCQPSKNKVEIVRDKDTILEFHYDQQEKTMKNCHHNLDHNGDCKNITEVPTCVNKQKVMEQGIDLCFPWSRSPSLKASKESTGSSLLTENPLSKRDKDNISQQAPQDLDLAVHDQTLFNESIIGPVKHKRMDEHRHDKLKKPKENTQHDYSTSFEQMMSISANTEKKKGNHMQSECDGPFNDPFMMAKDVEPKLTDVHSSEPTEMRLDRNINAQHYQWKDFVSGQFTKNTDEKKDDGTSVVKAGIVLKEEGRNSSLPQVTTSKSKRTSTFKELIHLKQETLLGLDDYSQDPTLSPLEWSEEPIMREVPKSSESKYKTKQQMCPFDNSLDAALDQTTYHNSCGNASSNSQCTAVSTQSLSEQEVPILYGNYLHSEHEPSKLINSQSSTCSESINPYPNTEHTEVPDIPSLGYETVICSTETHQWHPKPDSNMQIISNFEEPGETCNTHFTVMNSSLLIPFSIRVGNIEGARSVSTQTTPSYASECLGTDVVDKIQTIPNINLEHMLLNNCSKEVPTNNDGNCNSLKLLNSQCRDKTQTDQSNVYSNIIDSQQASLTETTKDTTDKDGCNVCTAYENNDQSNPDPALNRIYDETVFTPNHTRNQNCSRDAWMQTDLSATSEVDVLRGEVERLKEELKMKESAIIWQSLIIKILNM